MLYRPAMTLDEVYQTLSPQPLLDPEAFHAFYRDEVNAVRGEDVVAFMGLGLRRSFGGTFYKAFLIGHPGVGKSTEMVRLGREVANRFSLVRFSAVSDLDQGGFRPFDVLLAMMIRLAEEIQKPVSDGGPGGQLPKSLIQQIWSWFATEKKTLAGSIRTEVGAAAGVKPTPISWTALLGLFADLKGEIKYTADRKQEITEYRLTTIASLIRLMNAVLDEANELLKKKVGREWLFIGEDFDKSGIPAPLTESLFLHYANLFDELHTHLIFSLPVTLAYSDKATQLPLSSRCIPDTPVFHPDHTPHEAGRGALRTVLQARVSPALFEVEQMERLIVASGGNLRDLFEMVANAADRSALGPGRPTRITVAAATDAINAKRSDYVRRLGSSPHDTQLFTYEEKASRLVGIYRRVPGHVVPDPVLHSLLRARAVQEFDGERWFGVHPLVVDTLKRDGKLRPVKNQHVHGGTD
jgi:hypothetical protein